ncbi:MAG: CXXX repeat peptide maturase [Bacteroidaceae bacterium]|nr:CXXX repeat peptide maturase [Bacteroidaceae bacterium]
MLQYLVILIDDTAPSFCHYTNPKTQRRLIPLETLKAGIHWAMTENLMIQFVVPTDALPEAYEKAMQSIDHSRIAACESVSANDADVLVCNDWNTLPKEASVPIVVRTSKAEFLEKHMELLPLIGNAPRVNVVFTDMESFSDSELPTYRKVLDTLADEIEKLFVAGKSPQLNLLTDRMMLREMNNCGAGDTTLTLAPDGKLYVCPAFYYEHDAAGCLDEPRRGLEIPNLQLYKLSHAPICKHCDAWQCKRCVWLNQRMTLEVNTPSHQQCVVAHTERAASARLLQNIRKHGTFLPDQPEIKELDYTDPFQKREKW